jgi:hypothetical protein
MERLIKPVLRVLDSIPMINCGGCGYSALAIYEWVKGNIPKEDIKELKLFIIC